jgi:indole-3-glycerol phosphate synthase
MRIGVRHRRRGMIDRILIPKRAQVARMLAGPAIPPRQWAPHGVGFEGAINRPEGAPPRVLAAVIRGPTPIVDADSPPPPPSPDPTALAIDRARRGAHAILVATDGPFLGGTFAELAAIRAALDDTLGSARPLLVAMDFVINAIQLDRALDAGADAVLLIARIVEPGALLTLVDAARTRGLTPLVEIASDEDFATAKAAGARVVGVSARDLNTGRSDPERGAALLDQIDRSIVAIDLGGVRSERADAVLSGDG